MKSAIFPLSANPPHYGHFWLIETAAKLTDKLVVGIGDNEDKNYAFTNEERVEMVKSAIDLPNVEVVGYPKMYLWEFAKKMNIPVLIRGMRSANDFSGEKALQNYNQDKWPELTTVYIVSPDKISDFSSSLVRDLTKDVSDLEIRCLKKLVPEPILKRLLEKELARKALPNEKGL
jgi:pantetheine-phosphate adenylyltransferase